jgi:hypothetical protein
VRTLDRTPVDATRGETHRPACAHSRRGYGASSTPGLRIRRGSRASLIARIAAISAGLAERSSAARLAIPMPCSALMLPPIAATKPNTASSTSESSGGGPRFRKKPPEETFSGLRYSGRAEHRLLRLPTSISITPISYLNRAFARNPSSSAIKTADPRMCRSSVLRTPSCPKSVTRFRSSAPKVEQPTRNGVVTDVRDRMITVQWATGGQTAFVPAPGTLTVLGAADTRRRRTNVSAKRRGVPAEPSRLRRRRRRRRPCARRQYPRQQRKMPPRRRPHANRSANPASSWETNRTVSAPNR